MWAKTKTLLGLVADLITIALIIPVGLWKVSSSFFSTTGVWSFLLFAVVIAGAAILAIRLWGKRFKDIQAKMREEKIAQDVHVIQETRVKGKSLRELLPKDSVLNRWLDESDYRAKLWAEDAGDRNVNLYLDVHDNKNVRVIMQTLYYSEWKKLGLIKYCGSMSHEKIEDSTYPPQKALFMQVHGWRGVVDKIHQKIQDQLPSTYSLQIASNPSDVRVNFSFQQGRVERRRRFSFNKEVLKDEDSGEEWKL